MKKSFLYLWSLFAAVILTPPANISAQSWPASAPADGGTYYLYNVGRAAFMYGHNDWDTRASLTQEGGIPVTLTLSNGAYSISTAPTYNNLFLGYDGSNAYVDVGSTDSKFRTWKFTPVTGEENTYLLQETTGSLYLTGHSTDAMKTSMTSDNPTTSLGYWKLVTKEDLIASMALADADHPVDATFLIGDPYFGRVTSPGTFWTGSFTTHGGVNDNYCIEEYNKTFDLYQTLTDMPNGVYKLKCQGFYRMGGRSAARDSRNAGTEALNAKYYINNTEGSMMSIFDGNYAKSYTSGYNENSAYTVDGEARYLPNTLAQAANCMRKNDYQNDYIEAIVTDGTIRIGARKTVTVSSDWTAFDNFVLTYYGVDMSAMIDQSKARWESKYEAIAAQAADRSAYDAVMDDEAIADYCTTEEKLAEYDGIVWQAVCDMLKDTDNANVLFDITSLVENPTFDTSVAGWDIVGNAGNNATYGVAEFYNQSGVSLTQTLANMPAGTYTLKSQAFYRSTAWRTAVVNYQIGTDEVKANLVLGNETAPICNIYDQTRFVPPYIDGYAGGSNQKMAPDTMHGASAAFDIGQYWNLLNTTTTADADLTFGLNIIGGLANNWTCFDNFRLYYNASGISAVPVDLTAGLPTNDTQASSVTTNITLNAGEYNKVCLPFELDDAQTAAAFTHAYTLAGVTSEGVGQLVPVYEMEAGKAYFVTVATTQTLSINTPVRIRVAQPDSIPVMWEGAATVGSFDGFTFDVNCSPGFNITSYAPIYFQNVSFMVNQENWRARRFLNEFTYDENTASKIEAYNAGTPMPLDHPHSVFIPVPQNNSTLTVTISKNSNYSDAETFTFDATTLCEVPNLIPQTTFFYKVEGEGGVLTQGQFQTQGRLRMIKTLTGFNIRDFGGWETLDGNRLRYGKVYRGGELNFGHVVSADDLAELRRLGIGAELDWRRNDECNDTEPTMSALGNEASYLYFNHDYANMSYGYEVNQDHYRRAFAFTLNNLRAGKAVYFHCRIGADRTGMYALLLEGLCGLPYDQLSKDYELTSYSEAGTRTKSRDDFTTNLNYIKALPGNTLQEKFFYYWNTELGIDASDLMEFIDIMVGGTSSITSRPVAFNNANNEYHQSLSDITAVCALGSTIATGATAQLSDGTTQINLTMSMNDITIMFNDIALEAGKTYTLTIPAGAVVKDGDTNTEDVALTFHTPAIFDGTYYLYNTYTNNYLSRGGTWATACILDDWGLAMIIQTDIEGKTTMKYFDSQAYLFKDAGNGYCWSDGGTGLKLLATKNGTNYKFLRENTTNNYLAVYNGRAVCDAREGDNLVGTSNIWTIETTDEHVANYTRCADAQAETAATAAAISGVTRVADLETVLANEYAAIPVSVTGAKEEKYEVYAAQASTLTEAEYYKETLTHLTPGLYRLSVDAFQRATRFDDVVAADNARGSIYVYANNAKTQLKCVMEYGSPTPYADSDFVNDGLYYPNQKQPGFSALETGQYNNVVYVYVTDGTLTFGINNPNRMGNGITRATWCMYDNFRLEKLLPKVTISETAATAPEAKSNAYVILERTLQKDIWNNFSLPFDLTADQLNASALAGSTIYAFSSSDTKNITFEAVDAIEAGMPYLLKLPEGTTENVVNPTFPGVTIVATEGETQGTEGNVQFVAQVYNKSLAGVPDVCYLSTATGKLKKLSASGNIKGLRCYFIVPGASTNAEGVKFFFDDQATSIRELEDVVSDEPAIIYDLSGRRVTTPSKGFYIVNGKKIFVK